MMAHDSVVAPDPVGDTRTTVVDSTGVAAAGPDDARVAQGVAAGGDGQAVLHSRNGGAALLGATVGRVDERQAGILPTGGVRITDDMIRRAQDAGADAGQLVDGRIVRVMLEAGLRG
jgi:hypothetical protein